MIDKELSSAMNCWLTNNFAVGPSDWFINERIICMIKFMYGRELNVHVDSKTKEYELSLGELLCQE